LKYLTADVIQGFVGAILAKRFDGQVNSPECHREWWELCTSNNQFVAIAAPRGHAKSTAITFSYTLACALFRERKFVILVSDTEAQACMFLGAIKQELTENEDLIRLFKLKKNEKGEVSFIKETESDLIASFEDGEKFRIIAKGSEQKLRGLLWDGLRPDLIICDDMENDEIVMNQERRRKFQRWFYGALMPCRSRYGIIRFVGTVLHMDSMLENVMPNEADKQTVFEELKCYSKRKLSWKSIKYQAHNDDFSAILWPTKFTEEELKAIREDYKQRGMMDVYNQEYRNKPIDESTAYFKKADFLPMTEEDRNKKLNFYITGDLAISQKQTADWCVFVVAGVDEDKRIQIRDVIRERLDGREIVDTLISLQRIYKAEVCGLEEGQISKSIGPFLYEEMVRRNEFVTLLKLKHMAQDKLTRSRSIQARMRAKSIKFDKEADWYQTFEDECVRFPRDKHDDQVDAFSYLGLMLDSLLEAPTMKEIEEDSFSQQWEKSQLFEQGRNLQTGY